MANKVIQDLPVMLQHEGVWQGVYRHLDLEGNVIEKLDSKVICEFPTSGKSAYTQHNHFTYADGSQKEVSFPGVQRGDRIWWDTETFQGYGWEAGANTVMLKLDRKDIPGAYFLEVIVLSENNIDRARTWHWFKDGKLFQRTLCDERRVS